MKTRGIILIIVATLLPLAWYLPMMQANGEGALSQYLGSASLILMGFTMYMATRTRFVEPIFGSLDRVYVLHKWLAIGALITAYLHSQIDAELGNIALVRGLADPAEDWGELANNGLIFLITVSLLTFIPYKFWKWSHRFIGLFFAIAAAHYIFIEKPFSTFEPRGLYITAFCVIGVASYLWMLLPRILGHNSKKYEVTEVSSGNGIADITMKPQGRGITHKAGQFTFINFEPLNLVETHPFTIASAPNSDGTLNFKVKGLGRYTARMGTEVKPGMVARVSDSYGHFHPSKDGNPQVWVGAGIGITPFIAWAEGLAADWASPTTLYYCVQSREAAVYLEEFEAIAAAVPNFNVVPVISGQDPRLSAETIAAGLGDKIKSADVYFCGPTKMREALKIGLVKKGLGFNRFHNEEFEMRTGIGVMKWLRTARQFIGI